MKDKRKRLTILLGSILVITISITYAYYSAVVQGTGNVNAEASANTATIGEVEFNGENTFDTTNIGRDIYPGFIGVQSFIIGPYKDGSGIYEIDLEANVPAAFNNDIKLTIYKTTDATNNNIDSEEGALTVTNNRYVKQDTLVTNGTLEKVYEGTLVNTNGTRLEQVEFTIESNAFTTPSVTPDGFYTYYAIYEYLDNGNQNEQQGLDFSSKITVKYIEELSNPARDTLEQLQALDNTLTVTTSTSLNPNFARVVPKTNAGTVYTGYFINADYYITYASDFTYDETTGQYTLVDCTICQYSTCYNDLLGKYVIPDGGWNIGAETNTAIYQSYEATGHEVDKITSASLDGSDGSFDLIAYTGSELNEVKNSTWTPQTSGLFELEDDYGTSYYFRGDVTNNYVKFGTWQTDYYNGYVSANNNNEGFTSLSDCEATATNCRKYASAGDDMYWRIVRINGDGTIRMIYDGTSAHGKNDLEYDKDSGDFVSTNIRSIGVSAYNTSGDDNAYVGYMYGTAGSDNYNDTHANINNSTIKTYIDTWYENNLKNTSYESYIADSIFCNDRSIGSDEAIEYASNNYGDTYGKLGYGTNTTLYGAESRQIEEITLGKGNKATLKCNNKNDAFTVSDTMHGNGALDYPVGLITIDEANIAGGVLGENYNYYLTTGNLYWTGSPQAYSYGYAYVNNVDRGGNAGFGNRVDSDYGSLRPVINLKSGSITSGNGTAANPFVVNN